MIDVVCKNFQYRRTLLICLGEVMVLNFVLRWSRGERAGLCYPSLRFETRPKPSDFSGEKIFSAPSFGGEVKPSVHVVNLRHVKTQKWRGSRNFQQNSRQFLAHSSTFRCWGSLASFQTLGTPCGESWNVLITGPPSLGFDVLLATELCKTFLLWILNDSWSGQNPQGLQRQLKKKKNLVRDTKYCHRFTWYITLFLYVNADTPPQLSH